MKSPSEWEDDEIESVLDCIPAQPLLTNDVDIWRCANAIRLSYADVTSFLRGIAEDPACGIVRHREMGNAGSQWYSYARDD